MDCGTPPPTYGSESHGVREIEFIDPFRVRQTSSEKKEKAKSKDNDKEKVKSKSHVATPVKIAGLLPTSARLSLMMSGDHDDDEEDAHGHHHHEKAPSIVTACASALINFLLMFGLCSAYGLIMFPDDWHAQHRGLAVKMNLASAMAVGMAIALFSGVQVAIGGPDLNPVVFVGMFIESISSKVAEDNGLALPSSSRRLFDSCASVFTTVAESPEGRRLASGASSGSAEEFCTGSHLAGNEYACSAYHEELVATTIITVMISSAIFGSIFFLLGKFHLTRYVSYLPTNIMEAFLSCIGYKVFKYALKFCDYDPVQFIPAACIGVPLYFVKTLHLGNPAIVIPAMLLIPLALFYVILFATGGDVDKARDEGWMFDFMENAPFYDVWTSSVFKADSINWAAWVNSLSSIPIAIVVVLMDCLLKLHSTESKLPVKADKDKEIMLYGLSNVLTVITGGTVGYMQLKFNVINYGVMGNTKDRRGGMIYAVMIGVCWFGTTSIFNFMPRFFLSALLFFAGAGFVAENLWGSRHYLSTWEWLQILVIVGIFITTESLLIAVIIGSMIVGIAFILRYSKVPTFQSCMGGEIATTQRRNLLQQACVRHISNHWLMVFRLKGFIFFASAQNLLDTIDKRVREFEGGAPKHRRLRWIIFDCSHLDSMDSSATKAFTKFSNSVAKHDVKVLWAALSDRLKPMLKLAGTINAKTDCFVDVSEATVNCELDVTKYVRSIQHRWMILHPRFNLVQDFLRSQERFEPFREVLTSDAARVGVPWLFCGRLKMKKYQTLIWEPGEYNRELFLVHSGKIGLFTSLTQTAEGHEWGQLVGSFGHGWFLNTHSFFQEATQHYAVALEDGYCITWNEFQWAKLKRERPGMAAGILAAAMRQSHTEQIKLHHHHFDDSTSEATELTDVAFSICPPELQRTLERIDTAKELFKHGFFDPLVEARSPRGASAGGSDDPPNRLADIQMEELPHMPAVPKRVVDDLEVAWLSYSKWFHTGKIPINRVREALMYAGIFDVMIDGHSDVKEVGKDEFMELGVTGFMAKFNKSMIKTCEELFRGVDDDGNMVLDSEEVVHLFHDVLHGSIPVEEVEGMLYLWGSVDSGSGTVPCAVDLDGFIGLMARFVKRHEVYWHMLCGICDVMDVDLHSLILNDTDCQDILRQISGESREHKKKEQQQPQKPSQITIKNLVDNAAMDPQEAEELLWVADCYGLGNGETLDYKMVAAMILTNHTQPTSLPPLPEVFDEGDIRIFEQPEQNSRLVVEFRNMQSTAALQEQVELTELHNREMLSYKCTHDGAPDPTNGYDDYFEDEGKAKQEVLSAVAEEKTFKQKVHLLFSDPHSSHLAERVSLVIGILIVVNVMALVIEPIITPPDEDASDIEYAGWFAVELTFTVIFAVEYFTRLWASNADGDSRLHWARYPLNICDFVAILPFFVDLLLEYMSAGNQESSMYRLLRITRLLRLARVVRIGRLASQSKIFAPVAVIFVVIWGIYLKSSLLK